MGLRVLCSVDSDTVANWVLMIKIGALLLNQQTGKSSCEFGYER